MNKQYTYIVTACFLCVAVILLFFGEHIRKQEKMLHDVVTQVNNIERSFAVKDQPYIPKVIPFFEGNVPLHYYGVWEDIDSWVRYYTNPKNRWRILSYLEIRERYFPYLDSVLVVQKVPKDAKYIAVAESELNPLAISLAHAKGGWQFMLGTGRRNNLTINSATDERLHFEKATLAACGELKALQNEFKQFGQFESRMFALAGYNAGSGMVWKAIQKDGEHSYFLLYSLPKETEQYIPRIIALKLILENPERYGFSKGITFGGPSVKLVHYSALRFESWGQLAQKFFVSTKEMRRANAHILNKEGIPKGIYVLRIPERKK